MDLTFFTFQGGPDLFDSCGLHRGHPLHPLDSLQGLQAPLYDLLHRDVKVKFLPYDLDDHICLSFSAFHDLVIKVAKLNNFSSPGKVMLERVVEREFNFQASMSLNPSALHTGRIAQKLDLNNW